MADGVFTFCSRKRKRFSAACLADGNNSSRLPGAQQPLVDMDASSSANTSDECLSYLRKDVMQRSREIQRLDLSFNQDIQWFDCLRGFTNVSILVLDCCDLRSIPEAIRDLVQLKELSLNGNVSLRRLNQPLGQLHHLTKLSIMNCGLVALPDWLGNLKMLETLLLCGNKYMGKLNEALGRLHSLKTLDVGNCGLRELPATLGDLAKLDVMLLRHNASIKKSLPTGGRLDHVRSLESVGLLCHLKTLDIGYCELESLPKSLKALTLLEQLILDGNPSLKSLHPSIGCLIHLKKLSIVGCGLTEVPACIGLLEELEVLLLDGNPSLTSLNDEIGTLHHLRILSASNCALSTLTDSLGNLHKLQELYVNGNTSLRGFSPKLRQLCQLKKLDLSHCGLTELPEFLAELTMLEVLFVDGQGIDPVSLNHVLELVSASRYLKMLRLDNCEVKAVPDYLGKLEMLENLDLSNNKLETYPRCTLTLKNLLCLDLSNRTLSGDSQYIREGNCIKELPVELADTSLMFLHLDGNPIVDPPEAIWCRGISAIKSFMQEMAYGAELMCADSVNMIGDPCAGKTSIALSLRDGLPRTAGADERTQVMEKYQAFVDENRRLFVNVNDFGGHSIYHSVIPIFLPMSGLSILAYDMSDKNQESAVKKWLLTAIAKQKRIRVIVAGTRSDAVTQEKPQILEDRMREFSLRVVKDAMSEIEDHIKCLESEKSDFVNAKKLQNFRETLCKLKDADISVVTLSCSVSNEGLGALCKLVKEKMSAPIRMPLHWYLATKNLLNASSNGLFLTWDMAQSALKAAGEKDHDALKKLLQYLVTTSQIIWLEDHERLHKLIFNSPKNLLDICKLLFDHEKVSENFASRKWPKDKLAQYNRGILAESFMKLLLDEYKDSFMEVAEFLQHFNLLGQTIPESEERQFVVACNLPCASPETLRWLDSFEEEASDCFKSTVVHISFCGSLIPLSFFETSLSSMILVANRLAKYSSIKVWCDGLIIVYDGVKFAAERIKNRIVLRAFPSRSSVSQWTVLQPIFNRLNQNVTTSWHGASPECVILCPVCRWRSAHGGCLSEIGEIDTTLEELAKGSKVALRWITCPKCTEAVPICLCLPPSNGQYAEDDLKEVDVLFSKIDVEQEAAVSSLVRNFNRIRTTIVRELDKQCSESLMDELLAAQEGNGFITYDEYQRINAEVTTTGKARLLHDAVRRGGHNAIQYFARALTRIDGARPDLAALITDPQN